MQWLGPETAGQAYIDLVIYFLEEAYTQFLGLLDASCTRYSGNRIRHRAEKNVNATGRAISMTL
jgi:hypothetical protein